MNTQEQKELEEFKIGIKNYLDLTDQMVEELKKSYEILHSKYDHLLEALHLINTKVNIIASEQGITEREVGAIN